MADPGISLQFDEAFGLLNAEQESWLEKVYVPPPDFSALAAPRSTLVLGEKGGGKSALLRALRRELVKQQALVVEWTWDPLAWVGKEGLAALDAALEQLMQQIARRFFLEVVSRPGGWESLTPTSRDLVHWFLFRYLVPYRHLLPIEPEEDVDKFEDFLARLSQEPPVSLPESLGPVSVLGYLIPLFQQAGYSALVVLVEDVSPWGAIDPETVLGALKRFLSTLAIFDLPFLFFKMVLDETLEELVRGSGAVVRRRAQLSRLTWSPETLEQILVWRLQRVADEATDLEVFYERRSLLSWLHRAGGESPRDWLMLFASVLRRAFQIQGQEGQLRPLNDDEWEDIRRQYPVHLDYDPKAGTVKVNWRVVRLSPAEEILFSYLFEQRGEVCSLRDLYRAYERQTNPDTQLDELKAEYRGRIDTLVYRLRQAIEPDPWHPLLLVTHKGRGYCLR